MILVLLFILLFIILVLVVILLLILHKKRDVILGGAILKPNKKLLNDPGTNGEFEKWKKRNKITGSSFCLYYHGNNKKFNYVAASHTNDKNSETFKLINKMIKKIMKDKYSKAIVILEGYPYNEGSNFDYKGTDGEVKYAAKLATKHNIEYIGIECDDNIVEKEILKKYSDDDLMGYYFLSTYKYYYHSKKVTEQEFLNDFKKFYGNFDGINWFKNKYGKPFKYSEKYLEYSAPYNGKNATPTQLLSYNLNMIRELKNLDNLYEIINNYDNILYIMGANHVYQSKDILADTFGKYTIINS